MALQQDWLETDFYDVLGVADRATETDITKAYRKLARENHPDVNPDDAAAEERFKAISRAYEIVGDAANRSEYDEVRRLGGPSGRSSQDFGGFAGGQPPYGGDFGDLGDLGDLLGGVGGFRGFRQGPRPGADLQTRLTLDFADAVKGLETTLTMGSGTTEVKVRIPAGVNTGQTIRVPGKGGRGEPGAPDGDLFIEIDVAPHERFARKGRHLTLTLPISYPEAALGADIRVPTFEGEPVTVRVPEGTPNGRTLRVKGRGVATAAGTGDLLVTVEVAVPKKLSRRERKALKALRDETSDQPSPRAHLFESPDTDPDTPNTESH